MLWQVWNFPFNVQEKYIFGSLKCSHCSEIDKVTESPSEGL